MKVCGRLISCAVVIGSILISRPAGAQGGGSIIGTVSDQTSGVLPGVTVTVSGPALMGTRTDVTDPEGKYRFTALPPGIDYTLAFELQGFATVKREQIRLDVGFTATINMTMNAAGVTETVTVAGGSPVVDVTASRVSTDLNAEQLQRTLVGSRDYAAVMSSLPAVLNTNVDVAGSNATTMQATRIYGSNNGRGDLEGINSSYFGSMGLVGYSDPESYEDMAVAVVGNGAAMQVPGAFVNVVSKSGGNTYHGAYYFDAQEQSWEAHNIDQALMDRGLVGTGVVPTVDLNRFTRLLDVNGNLGGYIVKDKLWWFGGVSFTQTVRNLPTLLDDSATTNFPTGTGKLTYNMTPNHKLTAYGTLTDKLFKNYTAGTGSAFVTADSLTDEKYPIGLMSFGYESLIGPNAVLTIHAGEWFDHAYYNGKGQNQRYNDTGLNRIYGTVATTVSAHSRPQVNGSLAYFKNGWGGSHNFKFGGEIQQEKQLASNSVFNNTYLTLNNNVPTFVDLYLSPSETTAAGRDIGAYADDSWRLNSRLTLNLGVRYDRYSHFVPAQVGPQGHQFPEIGGPLFNDWAPRLGFVYALDKSNKTLIKMSYGLYWDNPGSALAILFDPNPASNVTRYNWINPNPKYNAQGLPIYEGPQQLGSIVSVSGAQANFQPAVSADPNLKNLLTPQVSMYFERELAANFGIRTGFVWNGLRNSRATVNTSQPFSAFNQPIAVANPGADGKVGTADDGASVTAYNLDPAYLTLPVVQVVENGTVRNSDYYTWEITANKRISNQWSLLASFSNLWSRDGVNAVTPNQLINTTDGRNAYSEWQIRLSSTMMLRYGIELSPMYRGQQGRPFAPTFTTRLNYNSGVAINAALASGQRNDNMHVFDIRAARVFRFGRNSLRGFVDLYNIFNTNAVQSETTSYGANYLRPVTVTGPRQLRFGVRFQF